MGTLSDKSIRRALDEGKIAIDPLDEDNIEPASVDLTLGNEAFLGRDDEKRWLDEGDMLVLPPGATGIVLTRERIELGNTIAANIGLRSHFTRRGIDILSGPQIDPGFEGPLHLVLINLSPSQQVIEFGEPFVTIEFRRLSEPVDAGYSGRYQTQEHITAEEIRDLKEGEGIALSEAVKAMQTIARDVSALQDTVDQLSDTVSENSENADRYMKWFVRSVFALVAAVIMLLSIIVGSVVF